MKERSQFSSKFGMLAAAVGSAVGLGNIWKFPYVAGQNGGGAFLLVYLLCVLIMGFPALITELSIGRMAQTGPISAFKKLTGNNRWTFIGVLGIITSFLVLSFYFVVAGWSLEYIYQSISTMSFKGMTTADLNNAFDQFSTNTMRPYIWLVTFIVMSGLVIYMGVQKGIEKGSKVMMPMLFAIMVYLAVHALLTNSSPEGYEFYLLADFSKITPTVVLQALGQSFFSLSIGIGVLLTYGSYVKEGNIVITGLQISILDTLIAFMAGLVIFPTVFSFGIEANAGPELAFVAMPAVFSQMTGGMVFAILFFLLLALAALTSTISLYEVMVAMLNDTFGLKRGLANLIVGVVVAILGIICCNSINGHSIFTLCGMTCFDWCDTITSNYFLPIGGLSMMLFFGWGCSRKKVHDAMIEFGMKEWFYKIYIVFVRFVIPILIVLIMLNQFGVLKI
ncbi:MAG: sodium-dependent transporter [Paludibacteraceae bacterium]|nr:sodium-dependent transporter [Paludibacteraceae bacterium]